MNFQRIHIWKNLLMRHDFTSHNLVRLKMTPSLSHPFDFDSAPIVVRVHELDQVTMPPVKTDL